MANNVKSCKKNQHCSSPQERRPAYNINPSYPAYPAYPAYNFNPSYLQHCSNFFLLRLTAVLRIWPCLCGICTVFSLYFNISVVFGTVKEYWYLNLWYLYCIYIYLYLYSICMVFVWYLYSICIVFERILIFEFVVLNCIYLNICIVCICMVFV